MQESKDILLDVVGLKTQFKTEDGIVRAVDNVSFSIAKGETLGIVGESGCGKSVTALSILRLLPKKKGWIAGGSINYQMADGSRVDIAAENQFGERIRSIRGNEIAMVFQEPMTSLSPVYTVGQQVIEAIRVHNRNKTKAEARADAIELLRRVKISSPERRVDEYPFQISGGMRQRVMIAIALSCNPNLMLADEPTTALDVTVEAQILDLIRDMQQETGMALMMITHDLGVIGEMADRVVVMYSGEIVEEGSLDEVFYEPKHPYTMLLLKAVPTIGMKGKLATIPGSVPSPYALPNHCYFASRCPRAMPICREKKPAVMESDGRHVRCFLYGEKAE